MRLAFGLTATDEPVEWFDTFREAADVHREKHYRWEWRILVYGYAERLCCINYNPTLGYFTTGFVTHDGVNLLEKHNLTEALIYDYEPTT